MHRWDKFCGINELQGEEKLPTIKGAIDEHTRRVGHIFNDREISKKKIHLLYILQYFWMETNM